MSEVSVVKIREYVVNKLSGLDRSTARVFAFAACLAILAGAFLFPRAEPARAQAGSPPAVPANLEVPAGKKLFFATHAIGTQNYICLPDGNAASGVAFRLFTPQATLFGEGGEQVATHYFGPNPDEAGTIRAAWQHSRDTSTVWGRAIASSTNPAYVAPGAIAWLLVEVVGSENGLDDSDKLSGTTHIQRLNTSGGVAPATGCASTADIGNQAFVPYATDYYFFK